MPLRTLMSALGVCAAFLLAASDAGTGSRVHAQSGARRATGGNPITGEGLPNPTPVVTRNWGQLPAGRTWGTSAGIEIDPIDGHIWAYERCGAGTAGGGPVDCDNTPVDPIFKFDRRTGAVLANFGKGLMVTPHGIHVDRQGNVWIADFAGNKEGTKGHQVHKFSPKGEKLMSLGTAGKPGNADGQFNQPNDVASGPTAALSPTATTPADHRRRWPEGPKDGATSRSQVLARRQVRGRQSACGAHGELRTPTRWRARRSLAVAAGNHRDLRGRRLRATSASALLNGDTADVHRLWGAYGNQRDDVHIGPFNPGRAARAGVSAGWRSVAVSPTATSTRPRGRTTASRCSARTARS